jgi:hypothetical protein
MTTSEWLYAQASLTEQVLEEVQSISGREFLLKRLHELQGRIHFEQRLLNKAQPDPSALEDERW